MLNIGINLSTVVFITIASTSGFLIGFLTRLAITSKLKRKVLNLETEMVNNHADILKLTEQLAHEESDKIKTDVPVITIGTSKVQPGKKTGGGKSS